MNPPFSVVETASPTRAHLKRSGVGVVSLIPTTPKSFSSSSLRSEMPRLLPSLPSARPGRKRRFVRGEAGFLVGLLAAALLALAGAQGAQAAAAAPSLSLTALGQSGSYFDVTIAAGESRSLQVARSNPGPAPVAAHSYAGSVFTIVNGGFGAGGSGDPVAGATAWVHYPDEVFALGAGVTDTKSFTVSVPAGTAPGQYISSIVLQGNEAAPGAGQVSLDRVLRQAVAIAIRVPGPLQPAFSLGAATHDTVGGRSVVAVALGNDGNENLKPAGTMTVKDQTQTVVSEAPVSMGSVYAGMKTTVAVTLGGHLLPGQYTVSLVLSDPSTGAAASIADVPFTVAEPVAPSQSVVAALPAIVQDAMEHPGLNTLVIILIIVALLALAAAAILLIRRRAKRKCSAAPTAESPEPASDQIV